LYNACFLLLHYNVLQFTYVPNNGKKIAVIIEKLVSSKRKERKKERKNGYINKKEYFRTEIENEERQEMTEKKV
jgi:hypothetical protein